MYRYMRAKFQFSSVILGVLDRGGSFTPPLLKNPPKKLAHIRVKNNMLFLLRNPRA